MYYSKYLESMNWIDDKYKQLDRLEQYNKLKEDYLNCLSQINNEYEKLTISDKSSLNKLHDQYKIIDNIGHNTIFCHAHTTNYKKIVEKHDILSHNFSIFTNKIDSIDL